MATTHFPALDVVLTLHSHGNPNAHLPKNQANDRAPRVNLYLPHGSGGADITALEGGRVSSRSEVFGNQEVD